MKNYSNREIKWLVEEYQEHAIRKGTDSEGRLLHLVKICDLWISLRKLSRPYYEAVLLCGLLGLSTRTAGNLLGVPKDTINRRYKRGMESLSRHLNNALQRPKS